MPVTCPKCGSEQITAQKKGFSVPVAIAGDLLLGPLGLAAGALNQHNVVVTCLACGYSWAAGSVKAPRSSSRGIPAIVCLLILALLVGTVVFVMSSRTSVAPTELDDKSDGVGAGTETPIEPSPGAASQAAIPQEQPQTSAPAITFSPSFDCSNASNHVERLVCGDSQLAALDVEMAGDYLRVLKSVADANALQEDQRNWLSYRNACAGKTCLIAEYTNRIVELNRPIAELDKRLQQR